LDKGLKAKSVKDYLVDTYYGYTYQNGEWIVDKSATASNALYQVPVMKVENLPYGEYTAVIMASYLPVFDHQEKGNYEFYLDAIRIYDPANDGVPGDIVQDAYVKDGEGWPNYHELRNQLIAADKFDSLEENDAINGIIFIDGNPNLSAGNGSDKPGGPFTDELKNKEPGIVDYAHFGPNNELYLAPGQAVAFDMNFAGDVKSVHLAYKTVGGAAKVKVYNGALNAANVTASELNTATDLYYDITTLNGKTVVIYNAGGPNDAILSITNIKVTYSSDPGAAQIGAVFTMTRRTAMLALASLSDTQPDDDTTSGTTPPENEDPGTSVPSGPSTEGGLPGTGDQENAMVVRIAMFTAVAAAIGCGLVIIAYRRERRNTI
jgi:hypothetical protein